MDDKNLPNLNESTEEPYGVLFAALAYNSDEEYKAFLEKLNNKNVTAMNNVLQSSLRYAQIRGAFTIEESEVIATTLRNLKEVLIEVVKK